MPVNFVFVFYTDKRSINISCFGVIKEASKRNLIKFKQALKGIVFVFQKKNYLNYEKNCFSINCCDVKFNYAGFL